MSVNHNFTPGSSAYRPDGEFSAVCAGVEKIRPQNARPNATPAITAGETIYVGTVNNFLGNGFYSFNANSSSNWFFELPDQEDYKASFANTYDVDSSAVVGADCTIYFLAEQGRLAVVHLVDTGGQRLLLLGAALEP